MNTSSIIKVNNVSKAYENISVLSDFSLSIPAASRIAITGKSGCGKTTLLRLILGLEPADAGTVKLDDNIQLAAVFQEDRLFENISALKNIEVVNSVFNTSLGSDILSKLGLNDFIYEKVSTFSGGMKRRVAIARALYTLINQADKNLSNPLLLIMDEPFKGLDITTKEIILNYINEVLSATGAALLLVTHEANEATALGCDLIKLDV